MDLGATGARKSLFLSELSIKTAEDVDSPLVEDQSFGRFTLRLEAVSEVRHSNNLDKLSRTDYTRKNKE